MAVTINDGSLESTEFTKEFKDLRSKFLYESLLPLGTDAFTKRGSINNEPRSPSGTGYIDQFSSMMEWSAILFVHERKFFDSIIRVADVVHKTFSETTSNAFDVIITSVELSTRDLKDMKKSKSMAGFLNFLQSINSIRSDFRMLNNCFEGISDKQNLIIKHETLFLSSCALFFDLKINENVTKPNPDATIHESVHSSITFLRKLLEHYQNLDEWIDLFASTHGSTTSYVSWLILECVRLIDDTNKQFQHDLHRQVYGLNNYTFIMNIIKENSILLELVPESTNKILTAKFHEHFDAYLLCWSVVEKSIEECRKTVEEKGFKEKAKQIYNSFDDTQKIHKPVTLIDQQLRNMIKSNLKDKLMTEYDLMVAK